MHFQRLIKDFNWSKSVHLKSGEPWKRHCLWEKKRDTDGQTDRRDRHRTNIEFRAHLHNSPSNGDGEDQGEVVHSSEAVP